MKAADLKKKVEELQADPEALKSFIEENEKLEKSNESLKAEADKVPNLEESVQTLKDLIEELNADQEEESTNDGLLEIGKKSYKVALPRFRVPGHQGVVFTESDLEKNEVKVKSKDKKEISLQDWAIAKGVIVEQKSK